jgi:hypothetical protein
MEARSFHIFHYYKIMSSHSINKYLDDFKLMLSQWKSSMSSFPSLLTNAINSCLHQFVLISQITNGTIKYFERH